METYKALYFRWPDLYTYLHYPMTPQQAFVLLVDTIIGSTDFDHQALGLLLRSDLRRMAVHGPDRSGVGASLIGTSAALKNYTATPVERLSFLAWSLIWSLLVCLLLWGTGLVALIFTPLGTDRGLGIDLLQ